MCPPRAWCDHFLGATGGWTNTWVGPYDSILRRNPDLVGSLQVVFIGSKDFFQTR